jgi:glutamate synthase (ferredoxin)
VNKAIEHYKAQGLNLSSILHKPKTTKQLFNTEKQDHGLENVLDFEIIRKAHPAIYRKEKMEYQFPIKNTDRSVGAILSNELSKIYGENGLPEDTLKIKFTGSAGQSFGAFATKGLTLQVDGNTNDYLGKGLSGAKLIIKKPQEATFASEENIIVGNVSLYGATDGEAYINGIAGERFCVRNSGVKAVVEGVGDHGCEYMTGGIVVVLGKTGRNFAAGMSGGIAYVFDAKNKFRNGLCNMEMVAFDTITSLDGKELKQLINNHFKYTNSELAYRILNDWEANLTHFIKVMPTDYKKALEKNAIEKLTTKEISA